MPKRKAAEISLPFTWEKAGPGVTVVRIPYKQNDKWQQSFLLSSDRHLDNPHSNRELQAEHLNEALCRKAGVIDNGDMFCAMQGKYDKRADKSSLRPEHQVSDYLDSLVQTAAEWWTPWRRLLLLSGCGNHECFPDDAEVSTKSGFKSISEITMDDEVLVMDNENRTVRYVKPLATHRYEYSGDLINFSSRSASVTVTPNHRIAYIDGNDGRLKYKTAEEFSCRKSGFTMPACGVVDQGPLPLSDDEIKFTAWMLTDSYLPSSEIYQSKAETRDRIRDILTRLNLSFSERTVVRDIKEICGRKLLAPPLPMTTFSLRGSKEFIGNLGIVSKEKFPEWLGRMSKSQFDVFLHEVILADGSYATGSTTAAVVYGKRAFLGEIQSLCVRYGYRASLVERTRGGVPSYTCLNISSQQLSYVDAKSREFIPYDGMVYCLTTETGNFFVRQNGTVFLTGNSSIRDRHETDLTERFCALMRANGSSVVNGGYGGFVKFVFRVSESSGKQGQGQSVVMHYDHGFGGGGPVTADMTQSFRRQNYLPDADIIWTGHTHDEWSRWVARKRISERNAVYLDEVLHLKTTTYKEEYGAGEGGWHVRTGKPPKTLGAYFLNFKYSPRHGRVIFDVERAS